jgi:hypothetical protein
VHGSLAAPGWQSQTVLVAGAAGEVLDEDEAELEVVADDVVLVGERELEDEHAAVTSAVTVTATRDVTRRFRAVPLTRLTLGRAPGSVRCALPDGEASSRRS